MQHLEIDWLDLAARAPIWCKLATSTRRALLEQEMNKPLLIAAVVNDAEELLAARWFQPFNDTRLLLHPEFRPFLRALRAMKRHRFDSAADLRSCVTYLQDNFTNAERQQIAATFTNWPRVADELIAEQVTSFEWLRRGLDPKVDRHRFASELFDSAHRQDIPTLVRFIADRGGVLPVAQLSSVAGVPAQRLSAAVCHALRHVLLFATLRPKDDAPVLQIWPNALARWKRPPALAPLDVSAPREVFQFPIVAEDAAAILVAASAEPLRLRASDFSLFEKAAKRVFQVLPHLPEWSGLICQGWDSMIRVNRALKFLRELQLLSTIGEEGVDLRVEPTSLARIWLAKSPAERLHDFLDCARTRLDHQGWSPFYPPDRYAEATRAAFAKVPRQRFIVLGDFLEYQATENNPLNEKSVRPSFDPGAPTAERREALWRDHLGRFLLNQLIPLGGAAYGILPDNRVAFTVTPAGRYLLGLEQKLELPPPAMAPDGIIVQPNFDIVFLAPAPAVEASIARFSYRVGTGGVGTLFRLTPELVRNAVAAGLTAESLLEQLRAHASKAIPANVEREVRGWAEACRRVEMGPALLLRCPDEQTAAQVLAVAGTAGRRIAPTIIELIDVKQRSTLEKKLRARGIFLETSPGTAPARRRARR